MRNEMCPCGIISRYATVQAMTTGHASGQFLCVTRRVHDRVESSIIARNLDLDIAGTDFVLTVFVLILYI